MKKQKAFVVKFENGYYWKGHGGKLTKELRSASFLRICDISEENINHIKNMVKLNYGLVNPILVQIQIEEI